MTIVFLVSHFNQKDVSYVDESRFTCALLVQLEKISTRIYAFSASTPIFCRTKRMMMYWMVSTIFLPVVFHCFTLLYKMVFC